MLFTNMWATSGPKMGIFDRAIWSISRPKEALLIDPTQPHFWPFQPHLGQAMPWACQVGFWCPRCMWETISNSQHETSVGIMTWNCIFVKHKKLRQNILFGKCLSRRQILWRYQVVFSKPWECQACFKWTNQKSRRHLSKIKRIFYMGKTRAKIHLLLGNEGPFRPSSPQNSPYFIFQSSSSLLSSPFSPNQEQNPKHKMKIKM